MVKWFATNIWIIQFMDNLLKWAGCISAVIGAFLITFKVEPWNVVFANLGAFFYLLWGIRIKELNIILVNIVFLGIYGYGVYIRL